MNHAELKAIAAAPVGSRVWFEGQKRPFTVRARSRRFVVCTKPFFKTVLYTIIDFKEMVRGPENLVFGMGAETLAQCEAMIDRLEGRNMGASGMKHTEVSYRRRVPLDVRRVEPPTPPNPHLPVPRTGEETPDHG